MRQAQQASITNRFDRVGVVISWSAVLPFQELWSAHPRAIADEFGSLCAGQQRRATNAKHCFVLERRNLRCCRYTTSDENGLVLAPSSASSFTNLAQRVRCRQASHHTLYEWAKMPNVRNI